MCCVASEDSMNNIHFPPTSLLLEAAVTIINVRIIMIITNIISIIITNSIIINKTVITIVGGSSCQSCAVPSRLINYSEAACLLYLFHISLTIATCRTKA